MVQKSHKNFNKSLIAKSVSLMLGTSVMAPVLAEEINQEEAVEVIEVTGMRGSLSQSMNIKRQSSGVVDAISAVDMGKFPDSNLAESLQRITGVSINRVNGEGSEVTVRGFGGNFNLVTLNGRQMPAANVGTITGNPQDKGTAGTSRSFDFANLASEGVSGIEVYKTGRAAGASGGIGATININTLKPLEQSENSSSIGIKAVKDESGSGVTPELSAVTTWINEESTFGVSLFGSFQERDSGSRHASTEVYELREYNGSADLDSLTVPGATVINEPNIGQIIAIPSNIGLGINEDNRERTNAMLTVQFEPIQDLRFTFDATYAKNEKESTSLIDGIWFARQFSSVEFDGNPVVSTPVKFSETGGPNNTVVGKDFFFQNLALATKDELKSFGFNVAYDVSDDLNLRFDIASSEATSGGAGPEGLNAIRFNMAGATAGWQTADFTTRIPSASILVEDTLKGGNGNGIFDKADVGSQVSQTDKSNQYSDVDQVRFEGQWVGDEVIVDFGLGYITTEMRQTRQASTDALGDWGVTNPGDIPEGLFSQSCTACAFEDHDMSGVDGADANSPGGTTIPLGSVSFSGDPLALLNAVGPAYGVSLADRSINTDDDNTVEEDILSAYVQASMDYEIADMTLNVVAGLRYEQTDVTSSSKQFLPTEIIWEADNDFLPVLGTTLETISDDNDYSNFLPSIDLTLNVTSDIKARASFSKTLARPSYDKLFQSTSISPQPRITAFGGVATGNSGNAQLDPLESTNIDLSAEWYYSDSSVVSIGYYRKDVENFVGIAQSQKTLFGLLDQTSGAAGTTSGDAIAALQAGGFDVNEVNLFTMSAVLQNPADFPNGAADFEDPAVNPNFEGEVFATYDVFAQAGDPELQFQVTAPVNDKSAVIDGFEFAWQHFFGETGFGYQLNYTTVNGDIGFDNGGSINVDQFALEGLSDTRNAVLIYEMDDFSARIAYNWRDEFLASTNRGKGPRNPVYIAATEQIDINVSYTVIEDLTVSLDVINLTEEGLRKYGRTETNLFFAQESDRRFVLSANYSF
jgi:TonB-dependent receptor